MGVGGCRVKRNKCLCIFVRLHLLLNLEGGGHLPWSFLIEEFPIRVTYFYGQSSEGNREPCSDITFFYSLSLCESSFFVRARSPPRQYIGVHKSLDATLFLAHPRMKENMFFSSLFSSTPKNAGEGGERSDRPTIRQFAGKGEWN